MGEIYFLAIMAYLLFRSGEHFHCPFLFVSVKVQHRNLKSQKLLFMTTEEKIVLASNYFCKRRWLLWNPSKKSRTAMSRHFLEE